MSTTPPHRQCETCGRTFRSTRRYSLCLSCLPPDLSAFTGQAGDIFWELFEQGVLSEEQLLRVFPPPPPTAPE
jgi:hypothetical protein